MGLLGRLDRIEEFKALKRPGEEETAVIASEPAVKKAIVGQLDGASSSGLVSAAAVKATAFLKAQMKAVDPSDKHAAAKKEKFAQLLREVEQAPPTEEPSHVKKARDALRRVKTAFKESKEIYEKWEKGRMMFKTGDELKAMQQRHHGNEKCLEATENFVEDMIALRRSDARPPALPEVSSGGSARPKATTTRTADPTVRVGGGGGGYPSAKRSSAPAPSHGALMQAQMAAEIRAEAAATAYAQEPQAPKPRPPPRVKCVEEEKETVVLSYSCTCKAVAEICGISVDKARDLAESSSEFKRHLNRAQWEEVKELSLAIEKDQKNAEKEKEQRKKDKALNKITEKQAAPVSAAATQAPPSSRSAPVARPAGKTKAAPKPKTASKPKLAGATAFSGLMSDSDDDDDGGWSKVKK